MELVPTFIKPSIKCKKPQCIYLAAEVSLLSRPISPNCCWNCMVMVWEACQAGENEKCLFRLLIVILLRVFLMFECVMDQV